MRRELAAAGTLLFALAAPAGAAAAGPRSDASFSLVATRFSQFEETGVGLAVMASRQLAGVLALEGQLGYSPSDLGRPAFSGSRIEAFLGLRAEPRAGRHRILAAVRPGIVRLAGAPEPFACILIFPPPLACSLGQGRTLFAFQVGAGFEASPSPRSLLRLELTDLLLRYPGPAIGKGRQVFQDALWSHNPRASLSVGIRF